MENTKKPYVSKIIKEKVLKKQRHNGRYYCAGKNCAKRHNGKKVEVTLLSNFDHKKPWSMGGKTTVSNIWALCPNCHAEKTREDRPKIAKWKKRQKEKERKSMMHTIKTDFKFKTYKEKAHKL